MVNITNPIAMTILATRRQRLQGLLFLEISGAPPSSIWAGVLLLASSLVVVALTTTSFLLSLCSQKGLSLPLWVLRVYAGRGGNIFADFVFVD
jgi:hypothetical protein